MFHGRSANEVALASAAIVLALVQRLEKKGTLRREDALALLGDRATDLRPILRKQQSPRPGLLTSFAKNLCRRFRALASAAILALARLDQPANQIRSHRDTSRCRSLWNQTQPRP